MGNVTTPITSPTIYPPMNDTKSIAWLNIYPDLKAVDDDVWLQTARNATRVRFPENYTIFSDGDDCKNYLLIIEGSVKIKKTTTDGHEIILYHINKGQTCELTTCCLLSGAKYTAQGVTDTAIEAIFIPGNDFEKALTHSSGFRRFIFKTVDQGLEDMISLVEKIAFTPTHQRLAKYLLEQQKLQHPIETTHQDVANELGTAREVVSRLLKEFERHNWIKLHRGWIEILNKKSLKEIR